MEPPLIYVMLLLLGAFEFSSGVVHNKGKFQIIILYFPLRNPYSYSFLIYLTPQTPWEASASGARAACQVDYIKGNLWYNEKCFANREHFEVDYVTITFKRNRTLSESSSCFFSKEPFLHWLPCLYENYQNERDVPHVITFLIDQETESGVYLMHIQVSLIAQRDFVCYQALQINPRADIISIFFLSTFANVTSSLLSVPQFLVWISMDGGNTFEILCNLVLNYVQETAHSFYTSDIAFILNDGKILMTKAGLNRYNELGMLNDTIFTLYYDHLGYIHKLTPRSFDYGTNLLGHGNSVSIFGKAPDMGFETAIVPQYISAKEMVFFAYVPLKTSKDLAQTMNFKNIHTGKTIEYSKSGIAYIRNVFSHDDPKGFYTSVHTELIEPFGMEDSKESPCLHHPLEIKYSGNIFFTLTLTSQNIQEGFLSTDVEKTVLIPGHSSFMITEVENMQTAKALATMPQTVKSTLNFPLGSWFLYNFGSIRGRNWTIGTKPCNYWIQQDSLDFMSLNLVKYIDVGNTLNFQFKIIPTAKGMSTYPIPPVSVMIGNPSLLDVKAQGFFDLFFNYYLNIHVSGKFFLKGSTTLALIFWEGSVSCLVISLLPTIKSSCSYLRTMQHRPGRNIPPEDWISGVHKDSHGFNMIKTLPINYRLHPSRSEFLLPLTDNFYPSTDPSKPIPRTDFHKTKETGKYKQCANVTSREMCNCSQHQKTSHAVAFSDCKEKVHRFKFPVTQYPVALEIFNERDKISAEPPYLVTMTEVNMRENWQLKHNVPENVKKMKNYLEPLLKTPVYNPLGLNLSIKGSELFHFRVSVVPGVSFCDLHEEFQIYVDEVPLPFPGHALIAVSTSVVLGGLIFMAFVFQLRNIHPLRALKRSIMGNPVQTSTTTVNS
eukprot:XP_017450032.1 PREDICTED: LOW QUALITY PROTEIN: cation channel sperm-associated protein subunit beta isoform X1 [Rattus norvegicus]